MALQKQLRDMQDRLRNSGWRIQWIPWWKPGKPEFIMARNPLVYIGLAIFLGAILWNSCSCFGVTLSGLEIAAGALFGWVVALLGTILSAFQSQAGWKQINARCIDREICEYPKQAGDLSSSWGFRLVCTFSFKGKEYKVTPKLPHLGGFDSKQQVDSYLKKNINQAGSCKLWVNPRNPLQTVFSKKSWWL